MKLGLRGRVVLVVVLAAVVPSLVFGALAIGRARRDVKGAVLNGHLAMVRSIGTALDVQLEDLRGALTLLGASWADVAEACGAPPCPGATPEAARLSLRIRRELPVVADVTFVDAELRVVHGAPPAAPLERANTYGGYVAELCADGNGPCQAAAVVVQARARTGALAGFVVARLDLAFVSEALAHARLGTSAALWVVDSRGRVVASAGRGNATPPPPDAVRRALAVPDEGSLTTGDRLTTFRNLASFRSSGGVPWVLVHAQPEAAAYALAIATTRDALVVGGLGLAAALIVAWLLAGKITQPLRLLARRMEGFSAASGETGNGTGSSPIVSTPVTPPPERAKEPGDDVPLPVDAPGELGALARQVAEMERRVKEKVRLQAELARGAQLASVGALAAGVAHEINNPLTTILGYAQLLLEDSQVRGPGEVGTPSIVQKDRKALELIADEARRVQGIVRTLLDHARMEHNSQLREPLDVNPIVQRTEKLLTPTTKKRGMSISVELSDDIPRSTVNALRLEQVFVNLGQNAIHAMDRGGHLKIRTRPVRDGVAVEFVDTGRGIPEAQLERIFEPFFTTKGPGVGTGLGLAICRQIVLDHGGRIEVESEVGKGSTFRVILSPANYGETA